MTVLSAAAVRAAALSTRFSLVGLAPAEPLDAGPLTDWLAAGHAADMDWMSKRLPERLDPGRVLPGARTVIALAISYHRPASERSRVASYARGRDYHYAHRDRMKALRKQLLLLDPTLESYACVDTGVAMEKVWAERAGLGFIGKNGLLITTAHGSWVTLSVMFLDRAVDVYDTPIRACAANARGAWVPVRRKPSPRPGWWTRAAAWPTSRSKTAGSSPSRCARGSWPGCSGATSARMSVPSTAKSSPQAIGGSNREPWPA